MAGVKFTQYHEWLRSEADGMVTIGITDYAQDQLGDVVFVELPNIDAELSQGDEAAVIESVKAAGEIRAPLSGVVTEINQALADAPEHVNTDPLGEGWLFKLKPHNTKELDGLLDEDAYDEFVSAL